MTATSSTHPAHTPARPTPRRRVAIAAAAVVASATIIAPFATNVAGAASKTTTPKLGAKCNNSERGRTTNLLVCSKVGSKISWVKRKNPVLGTSGSSSGATTGGATTGGSTPGLPRPLDVIALVNGTGPATAAIKVDVTCAGLAGGTQATQSATFTPQGGTQSINFNLLDPGADNPTGSTCTATATVTGATPTLRILVDGRPSAGPAATTVSAAAFSPRGQSAITLLVDFGAAGSVAGGVAAPITVAPVAPVAGATTTTIAGATTTTVLGTATAPPASSIALESAYCTECDDLRSSTRTGA